VSSLMPVNAQVQYSELSNECGWNIMYWVRYENVSREKFNWCIYLVKLYSAGDTVRCSTCFLRRQQLNIRHILLSHSKQFSFKILLI
jgi:hypothetical protein